MKTKPTAAPDNGLLNLSGGDGWHNWQKVPAEMPASCAIVLRNGRLSVVSNNPLTIGIKAGG